MSENQDKVYERLKNSKFKQQKLPGWRPVPTIASTTIIFICFGVIFILLGTLILIFSNQIIEIQKQYDNIPNCKDSKICNISIEIEKDMDRSIMIYYQLNGFYQNHRRYVKSKSDVQLNGKTMTLEEMRNSQECDPVVTNEEMGFKEGAKSITGTELNMKELAVPCGLIAKSFFNDVFKDWKVDDENITVNEKDIAWSADKELKYKNTDDLSKQWINITNEHFIVWMRPAGLPNFRKLWGRIEDIDLKKGQIVTLTIENNFDVTKFDGKKFLILSTVNVFGGKNIFLGISYIVLGAICIILAVVFIIGYNVHQKKEK